MEKKKIQISGKMPCTLAMSHIECFLKGLRDGSVVVEHGEEKIVLHPNAEIDMDIEARTKGDRQRLVITLDWDAPEIEPHEYEEETPHEHHSYGEEHPDEMYGRHHGGRHGGHHAVHYPPAPPEHMHGFHSHYHCHGEGEYQFCHAHEHTESHHEHYGRGSHVHGYRGCCEGTRHTPHAGCCAEHNYGEDLEQKRGRKGKKF